MKDKIFLIKFFDQSLLYLLDLGYDKLKKIYEEPQEIVVVGQKLKLLNHSNYIWRSHIREDVIN